VDRSLIGWRSATNKITSYKIIHDWERKEKRVDKRGYVRVLLPYHPRSFSGGWVYEHRLVLERELGRLLKRGEQVHHISENKQDNSPENLFLCRNDQHLRAHDKLHLAIP
jgi:hypothetical protein